MTPPLAQQHPFLVVGAPLAVIAVMCALFVFYFVQPKHDRDPVRYALIMDILAPLFVVLVTIFMMITAGMNVGEMKGEWSMVGLSGATVGGPFLAWIISRKILAPKANQLGELFRSELSHDELIMRSEQSLGWQSYRDWRTELGRYSEQLMGAGEFQFINDLLPRVYYHGNEAIVRPASANISSLFVYGKRADFKIQVIHGEYRKSGERPQIFLPGTASAPGAEVSSVYFLRVGKRFEKIDVFNNGVWLQPVFDTFDVWVVSAYKNDDTAMGDYVAIDVGKYLGDSRGLSMTVGVVSQRPMDAPRSWDMAGSLASSRKPVPLIFRPSTDTWLGGGDARESLRQVFQGPVGELIPALAKFAGENPKARASFASLDPDLKELAAWLASEGEPTALPAGYVCKRTNQTHVFMAVLEWESAARAHDLSPVDREPMSTATPPPGAQAAPAVAIKVGQ